MKGHPRKKDADIVSRRIEVTNPKLNYDYQLTIWHYNREGFEKIIEQLKGRSYEIRKQLKGVQKVAVFVSTSEFQLKKEKDNE